MNETPPTGESEDVPPPGFRDVSVPIEEIAQSAQLPALVMLLGPVLAFFVLHGPGQIGNGESFFRILMFGFPAIFLAIIAHEGLHALGWLVFGRLPVTQIRFGIDRKTASPYAHIKGALRATPYRIGAALPLVVLGILPVVWGLVTGNGLFVLFGALMTSAAIGDVYVLWLLRGIRGDALVMDHPTQAGAYVKDGG